MALDFKQAASNMIDKGATNEEIQNTFGYLKNYASELIDQGKSNAEIEKILSQSKWKDASGKDMPIFGAKPPKSAEPSILGTLKGVAAQIGGEGKTPQEMPGFFSTLVGGPLEALKVIKNELFTLPGPNKPGEKSDVLKMFNLIPEMAFVNALSARASKTARELGASPAVAGAVDVGTGLAAPWALERLGATVPKIASLMKPAKVEPLTAMPKTAEIESVMRPATETSEEFGTRFKEAPAGYYQQALEAAKGQAKELYGKSRELAQALPVNAGDVSTALRDVLKESGLNVKIAPTRAERFAEKTAQVIDPIAEEQNAYQAIKNMTMGELQGGLSGRPDLKDVYRYILKQSQEPVSERFAGSAYRAPTSQQAGKEALAGFNDITLDRGMSLNDLISLRQRLNGARRATQGNDALFHQFGELKGKIDDIIEKVSPETRQALRNADVWYATEYLPAFGPKGALRKMTKRDAGLIVDELVPKGKKFEVAEKMIPKLPQEARENLQGAWLDSLLKETRDPVTGEIKPADLSKQYRNYSDRTKWALLGGKKPAIDDLMKTIDKATADSLRFRAGHIIRYGAGAGAAFSTVLAVKDIIEYRMTGNKRLLGYAGADLMRAGALVAFTRPAVLSKIIAGKTAGTNLLKSFISMSPDNPKFAAVALNTMKMLQAANQSAQQEQ